MSEQPPPEPLDPDPDHTFLLDPDHYIISGKRRSRVMGRRHIYIAVAAIAVSLLSALWAAQEWLAAIERNAEWNRAAVTAEAEIINRRIEHSDREALSRWLITYRFAVTAPERQVYENEVSVDQHTYERLTEGTPVLIKYLPSAPDISTLAHHDIAPIDIELFIFVLVGPAIVTVLILIWAGGVSLQSSRFERRGVVLKGEVISCTGEERAGRFHVDLRYKFKTPDDRELTGRLAREREDLREEKLPKQGDPVAVIYVNDRLFRLL